MNAKPEVLPESVAAILGVGVYATAALLPVLKIHLKQSEEPLGISFKMRRSAPNSQDVCSIRSLVGPLFRKLICKNLVVI